MKGIFYVIVCYCYLITNVDGQTISSFVIATDGQTFAAHGNISYTIGETCIRTFDKYGYTLEEGFQRVTTIPEPALDTTIFETDNVTGLSPEIVISCYPNPATALITIECDAMLISGAEGTIYNLMGAEVMQFKFEHEYSTQLDVTSLSAGQYLVAIQSPKGFVTAKQIFTILK